MKTAKWLPIPPEELQAAADANSTSTRSRGNRHHKQGEPRHHHGQGQGGSNSRSGSASASGSTQGNGGHRGGNGGGGQSRGHSGRNSTVQSGAPSTSSHSRVQSRTGSLQSSPRLSGGGGGGKGRRLPVDDVGAAFQVVKPASPVRYTPPPQPPTTSSRPSSFPLSVSTSGSGFSSGATFVGVSAGAGAGAVPGLPEGSTYYIPSHQPYYHAVSHPQSHSHSHSNNSNPNSHPSTHTHSPMMTGQYSALPGLNGFPGGGIGVGVAPNQSLQQPFPISMQGQRTGTGTRTPPYGMYQPQPQAQVYSAYDYAHGHPQGQPYPMYWSEHERHNHHQQGSSAPGLVSSSSSSSSTSSYPPHSQSQFGGIAPLARMQMPPSQPLQLSLSQQPPEHPYAPQHHHPVKQQHQPLLMFGQVEGEVPPATMLLRPPPPEESEAVTGYREAAPVDSGTVEAQEQTPASFLEGRGRPKEVVFGSIGLPGANHSPSPMMRPASGAPALEGTGADNSREGTEEKPFTAFSIGVTPGEPDLLRLRSRTRSAKARARSDGQLVSDSTSEQVGRDVIEEKGADREGNVTEVKVVDLIDPDTKWEFGTTKHPEAEVEDNEVPAPSPQRFQLSPKLDVPPSPSVGGVSGTGYLPSQAQTVSITSPSVEVDLLPVTTPPNGVQQMEAPISLPRPEPLPSRSEANDWEVKDFGYGFGAGPGYAARDREKERREEREKERGEREFVQGRPRRGSYSGGHNSAYDSRGRRGRGYGGRGGYTMRGYNRGGYQNHRQPPSFPVTPPLQQFQTSLPSPGDHASVYYQHPPPPPPLPNYLPGGYETYQPPPPIQAIPPVLQGAPVPVPISPLPYSFDTTSWYLLHQLEYYLSPQNLAQDFYLRQQVSFSVVSFLLYNQIS